MPITMFDGIVETDNLGLWDNPPRMVGDFAWLSDWQVPYHDPTFVKQALELAYSWGIENLILGGDFIDMASFSKWLAPPTENAEREFSTAEPIISSMVEAFRNTLWIQGNHEERLYNRLMKQIPYPRAMRVVLPRGMTVEEESDVEAVWKHHNGNTIRISTYRWCEVDADEDGVFEWRGEHPKNTSVIPTKVACALSTRFGKNVIAGHGHLVGMARDITADKWAIDSGIVANPHSLEYSSRTHSLRPSMAQGAVLVKNCRPYLITPSTDFTAHLKMFSR